ncbi:MAG: hypothetical protein AAF687_04965 [Pseudomonadota bacterium]
MLSLVAAGIYVGVILSCLIALVASVLKRQAPGHWRVWALLAVFFAVLTVLRLLDQEEIWRDQLRDMARGSELYENRVGYQMPIVAGFVVLASFGAVAWLVKSFRTAIGRRNKAIVIAQVGALVMMITFALRMISYSPLDRFLYGPLKLNWIGDIGSSLLVAACALVYAWIVISEARWRQRG